LKIFIESLKIYELRKPCNLIFNLKKFICSCSIETYLGKDFETQLHSQVFIFFMVNPKTPITPLCGTWMNVPIYFTIYDGWFHRAFGTKDCWRSCYLLKFILGHLGYLWLELWDLSCPKCSENGLLCSVFWFWFFFAFEPKFYFRIVKW